MDVDAFFSKDGVMTVWPSRKKRAAQIAVLERIAERFEFDRDYREREVNEILKAAIAISDYVLIRRELFETGLISRTLDGSRYWRAKKAPTELE